MTLDPKKHLAAAAGTYNPSKGWENTVQRLEGMSPSEYVNIADHAEPALQHELIKFCDQNRFSYAVIPHEDFLEYERGTQDFRRWFTQACAKNGQNPHSDVMLMTRVKSLGRANDKNQFDPSNADRVKDYLGGMILFMQGSTPKSKRDSVDSLAFSIRSMENDERTLAITNLFWKPLKHGFRAFKAAWEVTPFEETGWSEFPILASIKMQHESQMGIDRLTRRFMGVQRATTNVLSTFWEKTGSPTDHDGAKTTRSHMTRAERRAKPLVDLGRALYDIVHARAGLNGLLNPDAIKDHLPRDSATVGSLIKTVSAERSHTGILAEIHSPDILPSARQTGHGHGVGHLRAVKD